MSTGRPTKLTPEVIEDVKRILPVVQYLDTVAAYVGVEAKTWRRWLRRGKLEAQRMAKSPSSKVKKAEELYLQFYRAHKKAVAEAEVYATGAIKKAATDSIDANGNLKLGQWQAAAWLLERRFPQRWAKKDISIDDAHINRLIQQELARLARQGQAEVPGEPPQAA